MALTFIDWLIEFSKTEHGPWILSTLLVGSFLIWLWCFIRDFQKEDPEGFAAMMHNLYPWLY